MSKTVSGVTFADLPDDVVTGEILSKLDYQDVLRTELVCRKLYRCARDEALWEKLCRMKSLVGLGDTAPTTSWRTLYFAQPLLRVEALIKRPHRLTWLVQDEKKELLEASAEVMRSIHKSPTLTELFYSKCSLIERQLNFVYLVRCTLFGSIGAAVAVPLLRYLTKFSAAPTILPTAIWPFTWPMWLRVGGWFALPLFYVVGALDQMYRSLRARSSRFPDLANRRTYQLVLKQYTVHDVPAVAWSVAGALLWLLVFCAGQPVWSLGGYAILQGIDLLYYVLLHAVPIMMATQLVTGGRSFRSATPQRRLRGVLIGGGLAVLGLVLAHRFVPRLLTYRPVTVVSWLLRYPLRFLFGTAPETETARVAIGSIVGAIAAGALLPKPVALRRHRWYTQPPGFARVIGGFSGFLLATGSFLLGKLPTSLVVAGFGLVFSLVSDALNLSPAPH